MHTKHKLILVASVAMMLAPCARAQVVTNSDALSALPEATPAKPPAAAAPASHAHVARPHVSAPSSPTSSAPRPAASSSAAPGHSASPAPARPVSMAARIGAIPPIPEAPPPIPVIKPASLYVPVHPLPIPPPVDIVADAKGAVHDIAGGVQVTFGADSADLNATMMKALLAFSATLKAHPDARADIASYSAGAQDDLSTPRRLSLARGLAARAALIHDGIATTRIYVRPIGIPPAGDPGPVPDRIDVTLSDYLAPTPAVPATKTP